MIDPKEFRNRCGDFATGVTIICSKDDTNEVHGMTANGFMSVSLDPALVVVSIGKKQKSHELIKKSGTYSVNILGASQVAISNHFAGRPNPELALEFKDKDGIPVLASCISNFTAKVKSMHDEGDHTLFVGEVLSFEQVHEEAPILFHAGGYRELKEQA